jgi:hypothetical protein
MAAAGCVSLGYTTRSAAPAPKVAMVGCTSPARANATRALHPVNKMKSVDLGVPDCPDPGGGLSAGQLLDCPGHPGGLSGGTRLSDNSDCSSHRTQQRTVRLTGVDCPLFKSQKTNRIELVLDTVRWTLAYCPRSRPK